MLIEAQLAVLTDGALQILDKPSWQGSWDVAEANKSTHTNRAVDRSPAIRGRIEASKKIGGEEGLENLPALGANPPDVAHLRQERFETLTLQVSQGQGLPTRLGMDGEPAPHRSWPLERQARKDARDRGRPRLPHPSTRESIRRIIVNQSR